MGHSSTISPRQSGILGVPLVLQTSQLRVRLLVISGNILPSSAQGWGHQGGSSTKKKRRLKTNTIGNWYFTLCTCSAQLYKFVLVSQQGWPPTSNILSTISDILHVNQGSARYSRCRWIYSWNAQAQGRFFIKNILQKVCCGHLPTPRVGGQTSRVYSSNTGQYMYSACMLYISCYITVNKPVLSYLLLCQCTGI